MARKQLSSWLFSPYGSVSVDAIHRRWLVIDEDEDYCRKTCEQLIQNAPPHLKTAVYDATALSGKKRAKLLGNELDIAVLFAHSGFRVGDLMALAGTVKRGGCLVLCCPKFAEWPLTYTANYISHGYTLKYSRYIARLVDNITQSTWVARYNTQTTDLPAPQLLSTKKSKHISLTANALEDNFASLDQSLAYDAIIKQWDHDVANVIISAPRGRGKSSLLGIFVSTLAKQGRRVCITSSNMENTERVMYHATQDIYIKSCGANKLVDSRSNGTIEWLAPDNPALHNTSYDALIIDEAASLPLPILFSILQRHKKWVLCTTTLGYEGSGHGFIHKLLPHFEKTGALTLSLKTPLRWHPNDPLEHFLNKVCLFDNNTVGMDDVVCATKTFDAKNVALLDASHRMLHFDSLSEIEIVNTMSLLSLAHYQTTPDDTMRLMDSPDTMLCVQTINQQITGIAIINHEGGTKLSHVAKDIALGSRRPKGHLSAQRIALKTGCSNDAESRYWRINRIAIRPTLQHLGLGSKLLDAIYDVGSKNNVDALTTSYGTTSTLDNFWRNNHFTIVDKGSKPNKASGETSALAIKAVTEEGRMIKERLLAIEQLEEERQPFSYYPPEIQRIVVQKLRLFCKGHRPLESSWPYIIIVAKHLNQHKTTPIAAEMKTYLFHSRLNINLLANSLGIQGKNAVTGYVREQFESIMDDLCNGG